MLKAGLGYDIHRLVRGRKLYLGGLEIPFPKGLLGHSDGDCLVHALVDALLGASGREDIGRLFPDTDPRFKDIRSTALLQAVMTRLKKRGFRVVQVDSVIVAEKPKLAPYIPRMKNVLAPLLGLKEDWVGIKAKTQEGLGVVGRGQAVQCWALALIRRTRKRNPSIKKKRD
jgi:2-C-methyl-D-erythritol 2,4-cyclodiphosphate synthase